jgi:hypothetical protein
VTLSPFVGDLGERAAKSFAGALPVVYINYLVDGGLQFSAVRSLVRAFH